MATESGQGLGMGYRHSSASFRIAATGSQIGRKMLYLGKGRWTLGFHDASERVSEVRPLQRANAMSADELKIYRGIWEGEGLGVLPRPLTVSLSGAAAAHCMALRRHSRSLYGSPAPWCITARAYVGGVD